MSSTVKQCGFIAVLKNKVDEEEREAGNENQWELKTGVRVGYSGELVYVDFNYEKPLRERENFYGLSLGPTRAQRGESQADFEALMCKYAYDIEKGSITPYTCIYYNGGDSPLDMLTKDKLLAGDVSDL
ncbi:hypothetical protein [Paraburkholderia sp. SIMBA_054]|uniref:hypothetical protein n=1 Tax=Paraburkholderia sp. SIMBA_054 TaxID=3085795 RepID=UPI00397B39B6